MSGATVARTIGVILGPTTLSGIGATGVPTLAMTPTGQVRPPAEATRATAAGLVRTRATPRTAGSLTRPRRFRRSRPGAAGPATAAARVSAARPTATPRAGTAVTDRTPGTVPAVTRTRVPATGVTPAALMAAMADRATAPAGRETTPASVAAPATRVPMAGPAARALTPNSPPSIMMTRMTTPRLARRGRTAAFRFIHCMTIRRVNSTGSPNEPRRGCARPEQRL